MTIGGYFQPSMNLFDLYPLLAFWNANNLQCYV